MGLRVAMLCSVFPPSIGGIQTHTLRLGQTLARLGHEVLVVTRHHAGLPRREDREGVRVVRVGQGDGPRAWATASYVAGALAELSGERKRIDVLHAHQLLSPMTIGLVARATLGIPLVLQPHACGAIGDVGVLRAQGPLGRLRLEAAKRLADAVIAISGPIHQELLSEGFSAARLHRVANGVDVEHFRPASPEERRTLRRSLGLPEDGRLVVNAGRLAKEKGVDVLLEAWAHVRAAHPDAKLCVVGSGEEEVPLRAQAARLGLGESVHFVGGVQDTQPYLRAADAYALPSRTEGLPVALLEAMAVGLPIAATAVGGTPEVLEDGVTGVTCPSEAPRAFADALQSLLGTEEGARFGRLAREQACRRYAMLQVAQEMVQVYSQLLEPAADARPLSAEAVAVQEVVR